MQFEINISHWCFNGTLYGEFMAYILEHAFKFWWIGQILQISEK